MNELQSTARSVAATCASLLALSCSNSVGSSQPYLSSSREPNGIASINEQVNAMAVDDQRLYWVGTHGDPSSGGISALRSCDKRNCASSLVTYAEEGVTRASGFGVINGKIYWFGPPRDGYYNSRLLECDTSGCVGEPHRVSSDPIFDASPSVIGPDAAYTCTGGVTRIPLTEGEAETTLVERQGLACSSVAVGGGYAYWLEQSGRYNASKLQRTRTDFASAIELLADDLEVVSEGPVDGHNLALDSSYVYWSQGGLAGSIARCPLTGCTGAPEVITQPIRAPGTVLLDGSNLYWQHDTASQGYAISRCPVRACVTAGPLIYGLESVSALAVDDQHLYTATADPVPDPGVPWAKPLANILRIPK